MAQFIPTVDENERSYSGFQGRQHYATVCVEVRPRRRPILPTPSSSAPTTPSLWSSHHYYDMATAVGVPDHTEWDRIIAAQQQQLPGGGAAPFIVGSSLTPPASHDDNSSATSATTIKSSSAAAAALAAAMTASGTEHIAAIHNTNGASSTSGHAYTVEYLSQLLKDKKQLAAFPNVFHHLERLADEEIGKVRVALFQFEFSGKEQVSLPDADGEVQVITEKVFVPAKEHPDYNFVGRILGPRGMTAKQLEQETGCKIMVRGRGSMRDKKKEEMNRGKPNWEHLSDELHVLIQCEDTPNRARVKLARAMDEVKKLLVPAPEGEDELKRKQLMELAIINGTYRSASEQAIAAAQLAAKQPIAAALQAAMAQAQARGMLGGAPGMARSPSLGMAGSMAGAPIVMSPGRGQQQAAATSHAQQMFSLQSQLGAAAAQNHNAALAAQQAAILQQHQQAAEYQQLLLSQGLSYEALTGATMQYQPQQAAAYGALLNQQYADYAGVDLAAQSAPGAMINQRRVIGTSRDHPYKQ